MPESYLVYTIGAGAALVLLILLRLSNCIRYISNDRVGIVEKLWSLHGSVKSGLIALHGEAGYQPQLLRGGWHFMFPFQYRLCVTPLVTIPQGRIGYVFARDGEVLPPTQVLASNLSATDFTDAARFLASGGQRGPQRRVLREGTYAINLALFAILTEKTKFVMTLDKQDVEIMETMWQEISDRDGFSPVVITEDKCGIVTVHDGPSLPQGEIIAPIVGDEASVLDRYHNKFQDAERFLLAGGFRGRQLQVLVEGTYYVNRLFATVEMIQKTQIEVGHVGVVVSYTGLQGKDVSEASYRHGEMVETGCRGVWQEPLLPGKYAFNTYAGKVLEVPTTNFVLKWVKEETGDHSYDANLSEVSLVTKDAFEPNLPLSVVVHIDYRKAPLVIQQFGDVKRLVEHTLDPMVAAYFKNIGQGKTLIELMQDRAIIQQQAGEQMREKFLAYSLELKEVLIGTPAPKDGDKALEQILTQLRLRQIAAEQIETYSRQEKAAVQERELREAEAKAQAQQQLTNSEISIAIEANKGKAEYQKAVQEASKIRALADAEADRIKALATAEAEKTARVGIAQAMAIEEQVHAYGGPQLQLTQQVMNRFAEAIEHAGVDVVPRVMVSGAQSGGGAGQSSIFEALLAVLLSDKLKLDEVKTCRAPDPAAEAYRQQIRTAVSPASKT